MGELWPAPLALVSAAAVTGVVLRDLHDHGALAGADQPDHLVVGEGGDCPPVDGDQTVPGPGNDCQGAVFPTVRVTS